MLEGDNVDDDDDDNEGAGVVKAVDDEMEAVGINFAAGSTEIKEVSESSSWPEDAAASWRPKTPSSRTSSGDLPSSVSQNQQPRP